MRISRVQIANFRNFKSLDVEVGSHLVVVGENKVGKSNFLHALRLILDPSLPDSSRRLRIEDFWDGAKPLTAETEITVSVDLADFEDNVGQIAVLSDYLVESSPMVARLTYAFFPKPDLDSEPTREGDYDFSVYGGDRPENLISHDVRKRLPLDLLPALRDAESDLANWSRSPLRPLLNALSGSLDEATKQSLAEAISKATKAVADIDEVKAVGKEITDMLTALAGATHGVSTSLSFSPTDADRVIRTLRVFVDNGSRSISEASLGSANLIYLALKLLSLELEVQENVRDHSFLAIEEPEAHLHPHVQRKVFRSFLRPRIHLPDDDSPAAPNRTVLLSTHSPHIVSVAPLGSMVLLRSEDSPAHTTGRSVVSAGLTQVDTEDLERYLDVTRGEILFAKGVILVEGDAESFLVPALAKLLGHDLDALGISVCSVSGTNFLPYVKVLGTKGLDVPFSLLTDEDPRQKKACLAHNRVLKVLRTIDATFKYPGDTASMFANAEDYGVFVTPHTLEVALFQSGRQISITTALRELTLNKKVRERAAQWRKAPSTLNANQLLADIETIGKGRFAQRLASRISKTSSKACPTSVKKAIEHVVEQL